MGIRAASILFSLMGHAAVIYVVAPFFVSAPQSLPSKQTPLNITVTQATGSTEISQKFQPQPDITVTSAKVVPLKIAHIQKEKQIQTSPKISRQSSLPPKPVVKKAPTQIATKPSHTTPASLQTTKQPQVVASPKPIVKNTPIQVAEVPPKQSQTISSQSVPKPETIPVKSVIPQGKITPKTVRTRQNTLAILEIESSYTSDLLKAIERHRRYPLRAKRRGDEGEVLIDFTILKDGEITGIQITSSSNSSSLDHAASKAIEQLKQFRPIPHQLQRASWDFRVPVRFALN